MKAKVTSSTDYDAVSAILDTMKKLGLSPKPTSFEEITREKVEVKASYLVREMRDERLSKH
ncbi:MAG: hypothetical protein MPF33_02685 [Candidatus Aramenus sp.]|jgi:hypothetical protein|nr:hypothetical protein [Candidatus Aramenus sp.]